MGFWLIHFQGVLLKNISEVKIYAAVSKMTNRKHRDNWESKAGSLRRRGELVEPFVEVPVSISTKAKHLALMKAIMRAAERDWKWIDNFRFHDLRHTWASWLVQAGVPLSALQEMGGWESIEMVQRYAPPRATPF
ncbi:Integrase family protein [Yersinia rohdei]|uniref:Integrase family protein n=1 Tax=Yersinia rohdei TaxID=29485 RepID=A0A0U1HQP5_YERRO|nr:Integrase family protein [Yersinia rohdei]